MLKIQIWDTAGQERFRSIPKKYYEKADGMLLLFDTTDETTFANISKWTKDIHESTNDNIIIYLIANKCDLIDDRKVIVDGDIYAPFRAVVQVLDACRQEQLSVSGIHTADGQAATYKP